MLHDRFFGVLRAIRVIGGRALGRNRSSVPQCLSAAVAAGSKVGLRVTLQRANYRELPDFVALAHTLGVQYISFLAVDVANPHAFGRTDDFSSNLALQSEDLPVLGQLIAQLTEQRRTDFESGFIAESPLKLRRLRQYFAAILGHANLRCVMIYVHPSQAIMDDAFVMFSKPSASPFVI